MISSQFRKVGNETPIPCHVVAFDSKLGWMALASREDGAICRLVFGYPSSSAALKALGFHAATAESGRRGNATLIKRLQAYASGAPDDFSDLTVDLSELTPFQQRVLACCRRIPYGKTISYSDLAAMAGAPKAARAVGNCMAGNQIPLIIPCHRVVPKNGCLGAYSAPGGVRTKRRLLQMEAAI